MSWEKEIYQFVMLNWLSVFSIIIAVISLVIAIIYSRPQARLAKMDVKEKQERHKAEHYDQLLKWFFSQIAGLTEPSSINENAPLEGNYENSKKLKEISSKEYFRLHWENGLKHVMNDDYKVYELINSLSDKFDNLAKETNDLRTLILSKIKSSIEDPGLSTILFPIDPGKIYTVDLEYSLTRDWEHSLRVCSEKNNDISNCLASSPPLETYKVDDKGRVERYNSIFAQTSPEHSAEELFGLLWGIEKDPEVLKSIVAIRKLRYNLKNDLTEIHDYATGVIKKIALKSYDSIAECCRNYAN